MATKNIGYVVELSGSAQVRTADGVIRVLNIGDTVSDRDLLITGPDTNVLISFYSGQNLKVADNAQVLLDETVSAIETSYSEDRVDQISALQESILEGKDLSELEPTAAGNDEGGAGTLHQTPIYEREGREGSVETQSTEFVVGEAGTAPTILDDGPAIRINTAPSLSVQTSVSVIEDGSVDITFSAADADGIIVSTEVDLDPAHGTATVNTDGTITFVPAENFHGDVPLVVTTTDNDGAVATQNTIVTVSDVNDAPTLAVQSVANVAEDGVVSITYGAADVDGTIVSTTASVNPAQGSVVVNADNTITFAAATNFNGDATITVVTTDDDGATATQTSTITVSDVNDAPTLTLQ